MMNQIHIVKNERSSYTLEPVNIATVPSQPRKLFRIINNHGKVHYKAFTISGTKMRIELNKGKKRSQIFDEAEEVIETLLLNEDERNMEIIFLSDGYRTVELNEFGEQNL